MAELDHLIFAADDLDEGVELIESLTGARAVVGGQHVGRGTHNALLTFDDRTYFEIIGIDHSQPDPEHPRGFGLDDRIGQPPALVAYAAHPVGDEKIEDIAAAMTSSGFAPGVIRDMSRMKPDGELLEWRLTAGGDTSVALDGALPFAIDWLGRPSPAASLPSMGALTDLAVTHPNPAIAECVRALGLDGAVTVAVGASKLEATIATPKGTVTLSS